MSSTRAVAGVLVAGAVVIAGLVISPSTAAAVAESLAADPILFGFVVVGLYLVRPLLAWPTTPLAVVVGYGYGITLGVPIALLGVLLSVTPVFLLARWATSTSPSADSPLPDPRTDPGVLDRALERAGDVASRYFETAGPVRGVVAARLAPIPSDISTCGAAASDVRLRHLLVGTAVGELPWTVAAVVVGSSAATITTEGIGELGVTLTVVCLLAAGLLLAGPVYRTIQTKSSESSGQLLEQ